MLLGAADAHGKFSLQDVLPGSPAHIGGKLKKGDTILQVDGEDVGANNIVAKIKGDDVPGSSVSIQVTRAGRKRPLEVTVLRARKESVEYTKKTFELVSELAQMGGATDDDDIESPASLLEKELKARLVASEQERLQQEIVLEAKAASNDKMLETVKALVLEFKDIAARQFGTPATAAISSHVPSSAGRDGASMRDAALKVGRATQLLEESCKTLRTRVAGKLTSMDIRLKRVSDLSKRVNSSVNEQGKVGVAKHDLETSAASAHATKKLSEAATKLLQLQEKLADSEDEARKLRKQNADLMTQSETNDLKISLLQSKVQLQTAQMAGAAMRSDTMSALSAEPGGPALESNANETKRLAAELSRLKDEMQRQKQEFDKQMSERDVSLSELSSSLFAAQDRASASMSELVTLRMENLKLKEQAVEKERKFSSSDRKSSDEFALNKDQLDKQRKAYADLEALYMQTQQKYVATSQELTKKTREISELRADADEQSDLKEMLRRESS